MTGTDYGAIGRLNHMNSTFKQSWIYGPGKLVKINEKFTSKKVWTYSYGGTPQQETSQSRKPTTYRGITENNPRRTSGVRFGIQNSNLRCPSSYGSQSKTASSPGTILGNGVS